MKTVFICFAIFVLGVLVGRASDEQANPIPQAEASTGKVEDRHAATREVLAKAEAQREEVVELPLIPIARKGAPVMVEAIPVDEWRIVSREPAIASWVSDRYDVECTLLAMGRTAPTATVVCKDPTGMLYPSFPSQMRWYRGS